MHHFNKYPLFAILSTLTACEGGEQYVLSPDEIPLVVEGWIEEDEAPVVMVTRAVDLSADAPSFDDFVEKWCRVSIFDGDTQYVLTGRLNDAYTPSFIFTSSRLKGKVGHTYTLLVETDDRSLSATATMLPAPEITALEAEPAPGIDSLFVIRTYIDASDEVDYLKFFTRTLPDEPRYYPAFMATLSAADYTPGSGITLSRGVRPAYAADSDDDDSFSHFFAPGEVVMVKVCSLQQDIYDFWRVYDSNISLSNNIFFSFTTNCPSNIQGGLGYFAAYGSSSSAIVIPD